MEPLRPMNLGEILDRTFQIYRSRFLVFVGIAAIPALAMRGLHFIDQQWIHVHLLMKTDWPPGRIMWNSLVALGFYHFSSFIGMLLMPAQIKVASDTILDGTTTLRASLRFATERWRSYLWLAVLKLFANLLVPEIIVLAMIIALSIIDDATGFLQTTGPFDSDWIIGVLVLIGLLIFLWLLPRLSLAIPCSALEDLTGFRSLRRTWQLTKGARHTIVTTWLALSAASWMLIYSLDFLLRVAAVLAWRLPSARPVEGALYVPAFQFANSAAATLIGPVYPIALTLFYYDQRIRREGYDIERMMDSAGLTAPVHPSAEVSPIASIHEEGQL
jgi:hypothetical protein